MKLKIVAFVQGYFSNSFIFNALLYRDYKDLVSILLNSKMCWIESLKRPEI